MRAGLPQNLAAEELANANHSPAEGREGADTCLRNAVRFPISRPSPSIDNTHGPYPNCILRDLRHGTVSLVRFHTRS